MKILFTLILLIIGFSNFAFSQDKEQEKAVTDITVCPVKLLAVAANFRFSYHYIVKTGEKGEVTKIQQLVKEGLPKFIKDEDFIPCIENWKLKPSEDYFVYFCLGTSSFGTKNHISISNKTERIIINLGTIGPELIVEDKK